MYMKHHLQIWKWMPKVARNTFNIGEVCHPVCCRGNKTVKFKLWSTFSRFLLQKKISDANWLRYLFFIIFGQIWLSVWRHHLANLHISKTWISLEQKQIFENSKQHFSSHAGYLLCFKMASMEKMQFFVIVALKHVEGSNFKRVGNQSVHSIL